MIKLNCISCGHAINIDENVYYDYEGEIKCFACSALLRITMDEGKIKSMEFVRLARPRVEETSPAG